MKKIFVFAICCLLSTTVILGQTKAPNISFNKTIHDFGEIKEADGPVSFIFEFINTGVEAIVLQNVFASCGCTTPNWSKEPVLPGKTGYITAIYNPQNRPGSFTKTITVQSNCIPSTTKLTIKGNVSAKPKTIDDSFPYPMGSIRLSNKHLTYMNLPAGEQRTNIIKFVNTSANILTLTFPDSPEHLSLKTLPPQIAPHQEGRIIVNYDTKLIDKWGYVTDHLTIAENGKTISKEKIAITANIVEDFSKLTTEQRANAPVIEVENSIFDFGSINNDKQINHSFDIKNTGKSTLIIRQIKPTCSCVSFNINKMEIPAGKSETIKITFDAKHQKGKQNKMISIISNSPSKQKINLFIKGIVNEK